jgi:predicted ester cyclase
MFVKENKIAMRGTFSETCTGDIEGVPANGKKVEMLAIS